MEMDSMLLALCEGNLLVDSAHQGPVTLGFDAYFKSSPPGQKGRHFADGVFICVFMNVKFCILIKISLKFVLKGSVDNNPALV